ncbi:hypothetical protein [Paenibacillus dendritiformis]|uniref:hypothetical protein n=1 Tax=Paenibacillus dendritiformis TaxID=130049 RepID=UPI001BCCAA54|nr:hypothetical protein [Paenibacillus dendritiformis]
MDQFLQNNINLSTINGFKAKIGENDALLQESHQIATQLAKIAAFTRLLRKEVMSRKMDNSTGLKTAPFPETRRFGKRILHKYSNSIGTTFPERESCKMTGLSPVSLRFEAKGPRMM